MACPSCGKQATEYDEHKWSCLHCGNKFVFVPPSSPQTNNYVQNTVNVVGQPNYELDVQNAKPARPISETRYEISPKSFDDHLNLIIEQRNEQLQFLEVMNKKKSSSQLKMTFCLFAIIFSSIATIEGIVAVSWLMVFVIPALIGFIFCFFAWQELNEANSSIEKAKLWLRSTEEKLAALEVEKKEKVSLGHQPVCPFCLVDVIVKSLGLTHCPKCGKQFHYSNECSYPIKLK